MASGLAFSTPGILLIENYLADDTIGSMIKMAIDYVGVNKAAEDIGVSPMRVRVLIRENRISADEVEGRYLIHKQEIERFKNIPRFPGKPKKNISNP